MILPWCAAPLEVIWSSLDDGDCGDYDDDGDNGDDGDEDDDGDDDDDNGENNYQDGDYLAAPTEQASATDTSKHLLEWLW